ncbi:hypothetical protein S83_057402 [Arachis hypogaea]
MLMICLIPGGIIYYLSGLQRGLEHFVYFASVLFAIVLWVESLMMVVGSMFPNFVTGMSITCGIQGLTILTGGFYRLPNNLRKPFWKYPFYYLSFLKYAFQGSFKNEFEGLKFSMEQGGSAKTIISGRDILTNTWQVEMGHSKWVDLAIMFGMILVFRIVYLAITKSKEKLKPLAASINNHPTKGGNGIVLLLRLSVDDDRLELPATWLPVPLMGDSYWCTQQMQKETLMERTTLRGGQ